MPSGAAEGVGAVLIAKHELSGKGIHGPHGPYMEAGAHDCRESGCKYRHVSKDWQVSWLEHWAISSWHHSELWLKIVAEVDGCNVRQANVYISDKSFVKWFADTVVWTVSITGGESAHHGTSMCRDCCRESSCVDFDVNIELQYNFIQPAVLGPYRIRICGGSFTSDDIQIWKL